MHDEDPLRQLISALEAPSSSGADLTARLTAALHRLGALEARDTAVRVEDLERLLGSVLRLHGEERVARLADLQKVQFELLSVRGDMANRRLSGHAHGIGMRFARTLQALPRGKRDRFFDAPGYLARNPDVAEAGVDALDHYLSSGAAEGRWPFDLAATGEDLFSLDAAAPRFPADMPAPLREEAMAVLRRERPSVSVIVPLWNRARLVPTAVSSALLQSYAPQEVIVIDDGSEDGGPEHLRARFPEAVAEGRLRLLERPHAGVSAARNTGLAAASGEIVAYLDSDNRWEPDHLLYACAALLGTKGATSAYTAIARHNLTDGWSDILFCRYDRAALEQENFIDLNAFVHRRKLIDRLGGFDERLTRLVDWDLVLRLTTADSIAQMPVVTGHHFVERTVLSNLTFTEDAEANLARILANRQGVG